MKLIIVLSVAIVVVKWAEGQQSCQGQNDCPPDECCTIPEGGRKANATCQMKAGEGEECSDRPLRYGQPEEGHDNTFYTFGTCDCKDGLRCNLVGGDLECQSHSR